MQNKEYSVNEKKTRSMRVYLSVYLDFLYVYKLILYKLFLLLFRLIVCWMNLRDIRTFDFGVEVIK